MVHLENFKRELAKALKRPTHDSRASSYPYLYNIIEDKIYLDNTLESCVFSFNGFEFSLTFLSNLRHDLSRDEYFVIDGVDLWFNKYCKIMDGQLKRCPSLIHAMYGYRRESFCDSVLKDNSWILTSFDYFNPNTNSSLIQSVMDTKMQIDAFCQSELSDAFMPRGVWGIDYIFKAKHPVKSTKVSNVGGVHLIPAADYLQRIQ